MRFLKSILAIFLVNVAMAADLQRGISFTDGQRLTAANLQNLIDLTTITTGFYTTKSSQSALDGADKVLLFSPTLNAYRTMTANGMLYGNTNIIMLKPTKASPIGADFVFIMDTVGNVLSKASISSLTTGLSNSISGLRTLDIPLTLQFTYAVFSGSTNYQATFSNLFTQFQPATFAFTNLTAVKPPTNSTMFLVYDPFTGTNVALPLQALFTNTTAAQSVPADTILVNTANGIRVETLGSVSAMIATNIINTNQFIRTLAALSVLGINSGVVATTNHLFGSTPSSYGWVIRCTSTDGGYAAGDELAIEDVRDDSEIHYNPGCNSTTLFLVAADSNVPKAYNKTTGALFTITTTKWVYKVYATR